MRILLTGVNGQVGWELQRTLAPLGEVVAADRGMLDLADTASIRRGVDAIAPDLIVNPAAYTAVDKAESEPELAHAINATAPGELAQAAAARGIPLVHFSTDYVFDGSKSGAYTEADDAQSAGRLWRQQTGGGTGGAGCGDSVSDPAHQLGVWPARP
jgi:dTDP-4-dehydrorhamnose reductase